MKIVVPAEQAGLRLDQLVAQLVPEVPSRSFAARVIDDGRVRVSEKARKPSFVVSEGDVIELDLAFVAPPGPPVDPKPQSMALSILFEDNDVLVVDKPPGLVVHPGAGVSEGTLVNAILAHCGTTLPSLDERHRAGIVHRLDKDTSGVMVVAKSQRALTHLARQFALHAHTRVYRALVYGTPKELKGHIETSHGRDPRNRLRYAVVPDGTGKRAALDYEVEATYADGRFSLIRCKLQTGRTHQIRVQLTHLRCPLIGDALYGHAPAVTTANRHILPLVLKAAGRQMLHAWKLGFVHPGTDQSLEFEASLPADFLKVLELLRDGV